MAVIKDMKRDFSRYPATVGEMGVKDFFHFVRGIIQYECQESSTYESPGWRGVIYSCVAGLFSSPEDKDPSIHTVYVQLKNIVHAAIEGLESDEGDVGTEAVPNAADEVPAMPDNA
jgi:hypothetical protein